jgi:hypothetical protein
MQKILTQLEHKIGEKVYHFVCDPASPIEHVKEALFQFMKYIGTIEDTIRTQQAKAKAEETNPEAA